MADNLDEAKAPAFRAACFAAELAMPEWDRFGAAYHEAGHAVVAWALGLAVRSLAINHDDPTAGATDIASVLPEIGDRLVIGNQPASEPHHLNVATSLTFSRLD